jgi:hypothetical protein
MQRKLLLAGCLLALLILLSCGAPGSNASVHTPDIEGHIAGFRLGLWHGFTCIFSFMGSLFDEGINLYEVHNNGALYNLGFLSGQTLFGVLLFGGRSHISRR